MSKEISFIQKLLDSFEKVAVEKVVSKGDFLIREGEIEKNLYFIKSGAVRLFYLSEYEEHTIRLGYDGSLINSLSSFVTARPSEFYIQALRKTTVQAISKVRLNEIVYENEESQRKYIALLENLVAQQIDREIDLLVTSPTERLQRVLERSPYLFQHIPFKYIASYLRMKPETLSRIRNS